MVQPALDLNPYRGCAGGCRYRSAACIEWPRLVAGLTRMVRDLGRAEELAQDALVVALERWPGSGVPDNPGAWLMAAAKRRAIDQLRRRGMLERKHRQLSRELQSEQQRARERGLLLARAVACAAAPRR